jgi:hypothetical protein
MLEFHREGRRYESVASEDFEALAIVGKGWFPLRRLGDCGGVIGGACARQHPSGHRGTGG